MIRAEIPQCLPGLRGPFLFWSGPTAGDSPWTVGHHSIRCSRNEVWKRPEIQPQQWLIASFKWGFFFKMWIWIICLVIITWFCNDEKSVLSSCYHAGKSILGWGKNIISQNSMTNWSAGLLTSGTCDNEKQKPSQGNQTPEQLIVHDISVSCFLASNCIMLRHHNRSHINS